MDFNIANEIATSQYVWAILCILLGYYVIREMRKENKEHREYSRQREIDLMKHLDRSNESQERMVITLEKLHDSLDSLEKRIDRIEQKMDKD
ncbi:hypothetical protein RYX45_07630 [Alkalihalophilus pseudofirmus]|uniref:Uncharacterized protein n=1 Tax=Alkalihalophilus pseudofirmus TaxID=79885 RepID=A0AAJ2KV22_ALKPS|nr:hypothetical protein [Alkalihalophilus pseudofirmus]MDV2885047.1 hypothetical protein [Alkalihalophilus pseudofirmus]